MILRTFLNSPLRAAISSLSSSSACASTAIHRVSSFTCSTAVFLQLPRFQSLVNSSHSSIRPCRSFSTRSAIPIEAVVGDHPAYPMLGVRIFKDRKEVLKKVYEILTKKFPHKTFIELNKFHEGLTFQNLNLDSLDIVETMVEVETAFEVDIEDQLLEKMKTIGDLLDFVANHPKAKFLTGAEAEEQQQH